MLGGGDGTSRFYIYFIGERKMDAPHEKVLMYIMEENQKLRKLLKSARAELWHSYNRGTTRPLLTLIDKIDDQLGDTDVE